MHRRAYQAAAPPLVLPQATLESSLEALNVKKFDLAFAVDPLFHKTSAQFDEGGAKGALPGGQAAGRHASCGTGHASGMPASWVPAASA